MNNSEKIKLTDDLCKTFDSHGLVIQDGEMVEKINALVSDLIEIKNKNAQSNVNPLLERLVKAMERYGHRDAEAMRRSLET